MMRRVRWGPHLMEPLIRYVMQHTLPANEQTVRDRIQREQAENEALVERLRAERQAQEHFDVWTEQHHADG